MTPLEWPESAIQQPWASVHSITRQTCQSETWQPADYTTYPIKITYGYGDKAIAARKRRKSKIWSQPINQVSMLAHRDRRCQ